MTFNIPQQKEDVISKAVFKTTKKTPDEIGRENATKTLKSLEDMGIFR